MNRLSELVRFDTRGALVWTCQVCQAPVADGTGYIAVDSGLAARQHREAETKRGRREPVDLGELLAEETVPWQALHAICDPHPDRGDYWFTVERCRTLRQFVHWSAHLLGKRWIGRTDWRRLMRAVGGPA